MDHLEIERKFLIAHPTADLLAQLDKCTMVQTYLSSPKSEARRVRKCIKNGVTTYFYTNKKHVSALVRIEDEREITAIEYETLLLERDSALHTLNKERYYLSNGDLVFEIDCFSGVSKVAYMEVELPNEFTTHLIPQGIQVIKEVTDDDSYSNKSLAKQFPQEFLD